MRKLLETKSGCAQLVRDRPKLLRHDHDVGIDCIDRLDIAIDGQAADQTPRTMTLENPGNDGEIARATVRDRFENFLRGHLALQVTKRRWHCQLAALLDA